MSKPAYPLEKIKQLAANGHVEVTQRAIREAFTEYRYSLQDICEIIQELTDMDFHNSTISEQNGEPFDSYMKSLYSVVYNKRMRTYMKFQLFENLLVVSFHSSDY